MAITFNGVTLTFGKESNAASDVAIKEIAYPGVDGIEEMDLGTRGRKFTVTGRILDDTSGTFSSSVVNGWKSDRTNSNLVTPTGTKTNCVVEDASFSNYVTTLPANSRGCEYSITFKKLR